MIRAISLLAVAASLASCRAPPQRSECEALWNSLPTEQRQSSRREAFIERCSRAAYVAICKDGAVSFAAKAADACASGEVRVWGKSPDA